MSSNGLRVNPADYYRSFNYGYNDFKLIDSTYDEERGYYVEKLNIKDYWTDNVFTITALHNGIYFYKVSCNCMDFVSRGTCEHYAAFARVGKDYVVDHERDLDISLGKSLISKYINNKDEVKKIKKNINYKVELDLTGGYRYRLFVGDSKLYVLNKSKINEFMMAVKNGEEYEVGSKFIYSPQDYYIDGTLEKILRFIDGNVKNDRAYNSDTYNLTKREFEALIDIVGFNNLYLKDYGKVLSIKYELPKLFSLRKDSDGKYTLMFDSDNSYLYDENYYENGVLYLPDDDDKRLLNFFYDAGVRSVRFTESDINDFRNGLFKKIVKNIVIDDSVSEISIPSKPEVSIYFDLDDVLEARVIFNYGGVKVNYFDNNSSISRSSEDEEEVIKDIIDAKFRIENNKFIIDDNDVLACFIENYLPKLTDKYEVFLNKNLQNSKVINKSRVENNFSIGKDNILSYKFSIDGLDKSEVNGLLQSIKKKKKYYRLKNNDLINLESKELDELSDIVDDLGLSRDDISNGEVEIPKYRALYIDSLKSNGNIHTNNLFDKFIDEFKKYKDLDVEIDKKDLKVYRDYQVDGVKWLYSIYKCGLGGILADEMGLGKTLQTIGLIKLILREKKDAKVLIVSPTALVYNWEKEFLKFAPDIKYVSVYDKKSVRQDILNNSDKYNVFITSYGLIRNDNDEYENMDFELCVIDEAQAIKNYKAGITREIKKIKSNCKIALTGTPVENNIFELWSIFDFIMPGYLNNLTKFREKYNFNDIDDESQKTIKRLHMMIAPFILRRKKKDVLKSLPDKIENKIYVELSDKEKALYLQDVRETKEEIDELVASGGYRKSQFKILSLLTRLREICIDPSVVYENYKDSSTKIDTLVDIVKENIENGHKILIFSSFKRILDNVGTRFKREGISYYMIDGSVKSKDRVYMVDAFNTDNTNCFLITLKAGGTGLNLTGADTVIHLDIWWNPQVENQATDRAHRIGQKNKVNVIKIVTKGTIEERIIELQEKKEFLADNLIESDDADKVISSLTEKDIRNLLAYND